MKEKIIICDRCKEKKPHYAKGECRHCYYRKRTYEKQICKERIKIMAPGINMKTVVDYFDKKQEELLTDLYDNPGKWLKKINKEIAENEK